MPSILAQNLKMIREMAGASRLNFSKFLGTVSPYQLQAFEEEITIPKEKVVRDIAAKVGISEELLTKRLLTKKDIPVLVIDANTEALDSKIDLLLKQLEQKDKQIEQQQKVIDLLTNQLEKE